MYAVDPDFKMQYDARNGHEYAARMRRQNVLASGDPPEGDTTAHTECDASDSQGLRWALMTGLALLGIGQGFLLGRDQYEMYKSGRAE